MSRLSQLTIFKVGVGLILMQEITLTLYPLHIVAKVIFKRVKSLVRPFLINQYIVHVYDKVESFL